VAPDHLDEALSAFALTAPEYGSLGLSNHGPMACEAMAALGRADAIPAWTTMYLARLDPAPPPGRPFDEGEWQGALGAADRFADWVVLFEGALAEQAPGAVARQWVPRLVPGTVGAAGHGVIRTAHALRSLGATDSAPRRTELAQGLAYWAATYRELPGPPLLLGHQGVEEALAVLPYLPEDAPDELLITDRVAHVAAISDEFEQAVASLGEGTSAVALLDALAVGGARAYLRNAGRGGAIALIHSITVPLAVELVLPFLAEEDRVAALGYAWQAVAAIHVAYATDRVTDLDDAVVPGRDAVVEGALAAGDEHAIKVTEAALRCYDRTSDPDLLRVAADACTRLGGR